MTLFSKLKNWWQSTDPDQHREADLMNHPNQLTVDNPFKVEEKAVKALEDFIVYFLNAIKISAEQQTQVLAQIRRGIDANISDNTDLFLQCLVHDSPIDELVCIFIDWKAWDEIDWQLAHIVQRFPLSLEGKPIWKGRTLTTPVAIKELAAWLHSKDYFLLDIETGSDDYLLAVLPKNAEKCLALARAAGLSALEV